MELADSLLSAAVIVSLTVACSKPQYAAHPKAESGVPVAHVGAVAITVEDVRHKMGDPNRIRRFEAARKDALDELIRSELLTQEGIARGWDSDPAVEAAFRQALARVTLRKLLDEDQAAITDDEVKGYYEQHRAAFEKPARVRVQHLFLSAPDDANSAAQSARRAMSQRAQQLLAQLIENERHRGIETGPNRYNHQLLAELVRRYSGDMQTKTAGGDTSFMTQQEMAGRYGPQFADAIFAMKEPRQFSDVIETPQGFHIAWLTYIEPATTHDLTDQRVQKDLRNRLMAERQEKMESDLLAKLKEKTPVTVDEKAVESIEAPEPVAVAAHLPPVPGETK